MTKELNRNTVDLYFDMDGTLADLYGQADWLECLQNEDSKPYRMAQPLIDMVEFNSLCKELMSSGLVNIHIVTWLAKGEPKEKKKFFKDIIRAKNEWLKKYCDFNYDTVNIMRYGYAKSNFIKVRGVKNELHILLDDEIGNLQEWTFSGDRYGVTTIPVQVNKGNGVLELLRMLVNQQRLGNV